MTSASRTRGLFALGDIALVTGRNLRRIRRTPRLVVLTTVQPVLFMLLYLYVFGGAIETPGMTYVNYLLPAAVLQAVLTGGTTAVAVAVDLQDGMVDRFRSLPIARSTVLASRTLTDVFRAAFVTVLLVGVGAILGFGFHGSPGWEIAAFALVLAFAFGLSWLLILVGILVEDPETAQLAGLLLLPLLFASSAFTPVDTLPDWLQPFAEAQPLNVVLCALRTMTQGGDVSHWLWPALAWIVGVTGFMVPLSVWRYARVDQH